LRLLQHEFSILGQYHFVALSLKLTVGGGFLQSTPFQGNQIFVELKNPAAICAVSKQTRLEGIL
jgi:hypothetical protein